jgi:hypothetical protein
VVQRRTHETAHGDNESTSSGIRPYSLKLLWRDTLALITHNQIHVLPAVSGPPPIASQILFPWVSTKKFFFMCASARSVMNGNGIVQPV